MPDLAPEARAAAIDAEVERRRAEVEGDAAYRGLAFEDLIGTQGMTLAGLRSDPAVAIAALSTLWMERTYDEESLRAAYEEERATFEARYGEAARVSAIFLRGARFANRWNPRTFEQAERELAALAEAHGRGGLRRGRARALRGSALEGRGRRPGLDHARRRGRATFGARRRLHAARRRRGTAGGGPSARTGASRQRRGAPVGARAQELPGWADMRAQVSQELRRRFLDEVLSPKDVLLVR